MCVLLAIMPLGAVRGAQKIESSVEVTYLANEGFLIARGEKRVLVDALFPGIRHYPVVPDQVAAAMESGRSPFDGVDLALASHHHGDHFGADQVRRFLLGTPGAFFLSTPQAVESVNPSGLEGRLRAHYPPEGESASVELSGIEVTIFNLHHGRSRVATQNLGLMIDLDGFRVLHIGDTEISANEIRPLRLDEREIDLALLPAWVLTEPSFSGVVEEIGAASVAAMHLATPGAPSSWFGSAGSRARRVAEIERRYPEAWVPNEPLEKRSFAAR